MLSKVYSVIVIGLECEIVTVEVDVINTMPHFSIVGLADTAVQESKERIRSAIRNSNCKFPNRRIILNLAPADMRKKSPGFDLAMAIGILIASEQFESDILDETFFVGELSLNGDIRHVNGALTIAMYAKSKGFKRVILPKENIDEASLIDGIEILGAENLAKAIRYLKGDKTALCKVETMSIEKMQEIVDLGYENSLVDFVNIKGQEHAKRALEIAAAGAHNLIFNGPPGSGKTMLAKALRSILPPMQLDEAIEVTNIYSTAGLLPKNTPLVIERPFRVVHHTASNISIVGGGRIPKPGEVSLAHKGVLFLDELPEFPKEVLEVLRQPLEDRSISVSRAMGSHTYPASFMLIAAMNPCPCGYATDPENECKCSEFTIEKYQNKISGPLLDRIDMYLEVPRVPFETIASKKLSEKQSETSKLIKERVINARNIQSARFKEIKKRKITTNAEMGNEEIKKFCVLEDNAEQLIKKAVDELHLSARSYFRILKLSRTIADIENKDMIEIKHVAEALQYRKR